MVATIKHKWFVMLAGKKLPKKYKVSWYRLIIHDWSKFTFSEAPHYGRSFFGDRKYPEKFDKAWLHHIHCNPHHWQHWIVQSGKLLPMPKKFIHEMVADWMGAGRSYQGSWDMGGWLINNLNKIEIDDETRSYLEEILIGMEYEEVVLRASKKSILDKAIKKEME